MKEKRKIRALVFFEDEEGIYSCELLPFRQVIPWCGPVESINLYGVYSFPRAKYLRMPTLSTEEYDRDGLRKEALRWIAEHGGEKVSLITFRVEKGEPRIVDP